MTPRQDRFVSNVVGNLVGLTVVWGTLWATGLVEISFPRLQAVQPRPAERGSYPETRAWHVATGRSEPLPPGLIIVNTAGVCLYIYRDREHFSSDGYGQDETKSDAISLTSAMVAVPKTQLPSGTGCQ